MAENGALIFKNEDAAYAYQDGQRVKGDMQPASDAFEITREGGAFTILQDGKPIWRRDAPPAPIAVTRMFS